MAADKRGFFGGMMDRLASHNGGQGFAGTSIPTAPQLIGRLFGGHAQPTTEAPASGNQGFMGTGIPTLPQLVGGLFGNGESRAQDFNAQYGMTGIGGTGRPLMSSAEDPNEHPSQLRPSDHTVTRFGGQSQAPTPIYQGQQGAATSLDNMGRTVGTASMGQVEDMLGAGIGRSDIASRLTQNREMSQNRDQARASGKRPAGMSAKDWIMQNS